MQWSKFKKSKKNYSAFLGKRIAVRKNQRAYGRRKSIDGKI